VIVYVETNFLLQLALGNARPAGASNAEPPQQPIGATPAAQAVRAHQGAAAALEPLHVGPRVGSRRPAGPAVGVDVGKPVSCSSGVRAIRPSALANRRTGVTRLGGVDAGRLRTLDEFRLLRVSSRALTSRSELETAARARARTPGYGRHTALRHARRPLFPGLRSKESWLGVSDQTEWACERVADRAREGPTSKGACRVHRPMDPIRRRMPAAGRRKAPGPAERLSDFMWQLKSPCAKMSPI